MQKACLAKRRSEHSYKRAPSYTDVASMKLKQDVESSWQCPFVSVSEEESEAQHAFCNVKEKRGSVESPTLTQLALAFFLVCIHKTTHAKIQRRASASLSAASMRLRGRFVRMLTRRS